MNLIGFTVYTIGVAILTASAYHWGSRFGKWLFFRAKTRAEKRFAETIAHAGCPQEDP